MVRSGSPEQVPERPFSWRFTTPLFIGSAFNPINSSLIATALVPIAHDLNVSIGQTAALVTALYLASAIAQPTAGKAAEVLGPRRVFLAGIGLVIIGGAVGGLAQSLPTLILSRALIGLGTSCAYPTAMLLIRRRAQDAGLSQPPGSVLGGLQIASIATASLGLPLGGVLVGALGWRAVFLANVPAALVALAATLAWVSPDGPLDRTRRARDVATSMDLPGIAAFSGAMAALLFFLFELSTPRWSVLATSIAFWVVLVIWELRASEPFLDLRLLATNRALTSIYMRVSLIFTCVYVVLYGVTQWLQIVRGVPATHAGLMLLPMMLASGVVISAVSRRNLVRGPILSAAWFCLAGSAGVLVLTDSAWIGWVVVVTTTFGIAMGLAASGNQLALYGQAPAALLGTAAGLLRTFGYMGSIIASAITGIVFKVDVTDKGMHLIAQIMVGVSAALVLLTFADRSLRRVH